VWAAPGHRPDPCARDPRGWSYHRLRTASHTCTRRHCSRAFSSTSAPLRPFVDLRRTKRCTVLVLRRHRGRFLAAKSLVRRLQALGFTSRSGPQTYRNLLCERRERAGGRHPHAEVLRWRCRGVLADRRTRYPKLTIAVLAALRVSSRKCHWEAHALRRSTTSPSAFAGSRTAAEVGRDAATPGRTRRGDSMRSSPECRTSTPGLTPCPGAAPGTSGHREPRSGIAATRSATCCGRGARMLRRRGRHRGAPIPEPYYPSG
jgi:hypothetical protein